VSNLGDLVPPRDPSLDERVHAVVGRAALGVERQQRGEHERVDDRRADVRRPDVYGPPNPSAIAQISRLRTIAEMYESLRANPKIRASAMAVSITATR
jgi:hypothetical protein